MLDDRFAQHFVLLLFDRCLRESHFQHVFNAARIVNAHAGNLIRGEVLFHVLPVLCREDHVEHAGTLGSQELLLDAADRQDIPAERNLPRHRSQRMHRGIGHERNQGGCHGDAGRRPVLGNGSSRNVDVNVQILGEVLLQAEGRCVGTNPGQRSLHGFLHDLANLARHLEAALALHAVGFDEEHVAASRRPGKPDGYAGTLGALSQFGIDAHLDAAQKFLDDCAVDDESAGLPFRDPPRLLAADRADELLELTDTGFPRVVANDVAYALFGEFDLRLPAFFRLDAVLLDLPRDEVAERDVRLLLLACSPTGQ